MHAKECKSHFYESARMGLQRDARIKNEQMQGKRAGAAYSARLIRGAAAWPAGRSGLRSPHQGPCCCGAVQARNRGRHACAKLVPARARGVDRVGHQLGCEGGVAATQAALHKDGAAIQELNAFGLGRVRPAGVGRKMRGQAGLRLRAHEVTGGRRARQPAAGAWPPPPPRRRPHSCSCSSAHLSCALTSATALP